MDKGARVAPELPLLPLQICFAPPPPLAAVLISFQVPAGTTLGQAIESSALVQQIGIGELVEYRAGIWGKLRPADTVLRPQDRIEIYRPLVADPKEARRRRADQTSVEDGVQKQAAQS